MVLHEENRHANSRNRPKKASPTLQMPISAQYASWCVEIVGKGSFGLVRLATNRYGDKVAIKTVRKEESASVNACLSEQAILQKLGKHKNVVNLIAGNLLPGNYVELVMEYVPYDIFVLNPYLNFKHARHFFRQLVEGVEYIHSKEIAHRDIKIENLLITKDFLLKITDFGLATISHRNGMPRRMTGFTGTKCYMPPEMYKEPYKLHPVDVYACGITLIEMINGKCPWEEPNEKDPKYLMWEDGRFKHLDEWERMPETAIPLLKWILHPDPENRPSLAEIRQDPWYVNGCASVEDWTNLRLTLKKIDTEERKGRKNGRFRGDDITIPLQTEKVYREKSYHHERTPKSPRNLIECVNDENKQPRTLRSPNRIDFSPRIHKPFQAPTREAEKQREWGCSVM